jgi:hypothetical protein
LLILPAWVDSARQEAIIFNQNRLSFFGESGIDLPKSIVRVGRRMKFGSRPLFEAWGLRSAELENPADFNGRLMNVLVG